MVDRLVKLVTKFAPAVIGAAVFGAVAGWLLGYVDVNVAHWNVVEDALSTLAGVVGWVRFGGPTNFDDLV